MSAFRMLWICCVTVVFLEGHVCKGQPVGEKDERGGKAIDARRKAEVIRDVNALLIEKYIFLDVAKKMKDTLFKKLSSGDYDKINEPGQFASTLGEDLFKISNDRHFHLEFNPKRARLIKAQQSKSAEEVERSNRTILEGDRLVNFGFQKIEHLGGNVGYLDLSFFSDAEAAGETAAAAMGLLANADAIIVDLRENHGGWPSMVQLLCSYFVKGTAEGRTHLNTFERRYDNSQEQFWTLAYVPGKRMFDVDLYVLTSSSTASAAEEFTYNLKNLKRATIVGEKTAGAANPIDALVV